MKYDYIVIGAGSAGCVLATRLTEDASKSVLLLEAGPDYPDFEHLPLDLKDGNNVWRSAYGPHSWDFRAKGSALQTEPVVIPRGKATGGSSAINGQVLFRGIPEDYDNWAEWGNDEWSFTKVLPYSANWRPIRTTQEAISTATMAPSQCGGTNGRIGSLTFVLFTTLAWLWAFLKIRTKTTPTPTVSLPGL